MTDSNELTGVIERSRLSGRAADVADAGLTLFAERGYRATRMKDIGEHLGIRAPSLYNHVGSKQDLLQAIIFATLSDLRTAQDAAIATTDDVVEQFRRAVESHVRYNARNQRQGLVADREVLSLEEPARSQVVEGRRQYEEGFRSLIQRGRDEGAFSIERPKLASYAIIQMGINVASWFHEDGEFSEAEVAYYYADFGLRIVGAAPSRYGNGAAPQ